MDCIYVEREARQIGTKVRATCTPNPTHVHFIFKRRSQHSMAVQVSRLLCYDLGCGNTGEGENAGEHQWARQAFEAHAFVP